jgi:hypothetical protein
MVYIFHLYLRHSEGKLAGLFSCESPIDARTGTIRVGISKEGRIFIGSSSSIEFRLLPDDPGISPDTN